MADRVLIIGAGVAGLTAAHELVERGFEVTVYERRGIIGGKARSFNVSADRHADYHDEMPVETSTSAAPQANGSLKERLARVQGDVRGQSQPAALAAPELRGKLPAEHGFRFFPGWYKHLPDTMRRIPYKQPGRSVADNLVPAETSLFASYRRDPIKARVTVPSSWSELAQIASFPGELLRLGLTRDDLAFFIGKLAKFALTPEEQRITSYDALTWWEFLEADTRSREFQIYLAEGVTRNSVAAKAREASAHTIGRAAIQTLFDAVTPDRPLAQVLNGPTNEVWIDPWVCYLKQQGVKFELGWDLAGVEFDASREVSRVIVEREPRALRSAKATLDLRRRFEKLGAGISGLADSVVKQTREVSQAPDAEGLVRLCRTLAKARQDALSVKATEQEQALYASSGWTGELTLLCRQLVELLDFAFERVDAWRKESIVPSAAALATLATELGDNLPRLGSRTAALEQALDAAETAWIAQEARGDVRRALTFDYYVLALPVEQVAHYVNRSESLRRFDAKLEDIILLSEHVSWMAGIQFYLRKRVDVTRGHINCVDSEWALTAISQAQFWSERDMEDYADGGVETVLSVDISAWDKKGRVFGKEAWNCTPNEIALEVWEQLKLSLNRANQAPVLSDDAVDMDGRWYALDESIVERFDRKKQGLYSKFRDASFSSEVLMRRQRERRAALDAMRGESREEEYPLAGRSPTLGTGASSAHVVSVASEVPYVSGPRLLFNAEPLLINRVGAWAWRPTAKTAIRNLFLAGDYVRTATTLACMEGANEAARLAVNEILRVSGSKRDPCDVWSNLEPVEGLLSTAARLLEPGRSLGASAWNAAEGLASNASDLGRSWLKRLLWGGPTGPN